MARAGRGFALLYVVVALATATVSSRPVLPLFDGFAPPTPYKWVNPPPEQAAGNVPPQPVERQFALGPAGAPASNAASDDAQAIVGLVDGSVPPSPPDTSVAVRLVPVDPGTLGPLPAGLRAVSNAYRVELRYLPSETPLTRLAAPGTIALTAAETGDRLLHSVDGQVWMEMAFRPFGTDHGLFGELDTAGWFLVASSSASQASTGVVNSDVQKGVLLVSLFVLTVGGAVLVVRLPSPVPAPAPPRKRPVSPSRSKSKPRKRPRR